VPPLRNPRTSALATRGLRALVACAISLWSPIARADSPAPTASAIDRMAETVETTLRASVESGRSSAAFAVYVRGGEVRFSKGWGFEDPALSVPVDPDVSHVGLASISKILVGIALAQLKERHVIRSFDDPANAYLDEYKLPDWQGQPITLRHLATHTAGFDDSQFDTLSSRPGPGVATALDLRMREPALVGPPGRFSSYSSFGIWVLARVVADAMHQSTSSYLDEQVLGPLGMNQTLAAYPDGPIGHETVPFQPLAPYNTTRLYAQPASFFSGGIVSTAGDMAKLMMALLDPGSTTGISPAVQHDLFQVQHEDAPRGSAHGLVFDVLRVGWRSVIHHGGVGMGYASLLALVPSERAGIYYYFTGVKPVAGTPRDKQPPDAVDLYTRVLTALSRGDGPDPLAAIAGDASPAWRPAWKAYLGEYVSLFRHQRGIGRLRSMLHPSMLRVERGETGLKIAGIDGMKEIAPGQFGAPGVAGTFAFVTDPYSGHQMLSWSTTSSTFERPALADNPRVVLGLLAALVAVAATGLLFPFGPGRSASRLARSAAWLFGLTMLAIPLVLFEAHAFGDRYYLGIAWPLDVARGCAWLTLPIAATLVASAFTARPPGAASSGRACRLHLVTLAACACLAVVPLINVGLLGFLTR
jgi:CubicO group peptidase (beta-lactamase class C family)